MYGLPTKWNWTEKCYFRLHGNFGDFRMDGSGLGFAFVVSNDSSPWCLIPINSL